MSPNSTIQGVPQDVHPIIFDSIDASLIRSIVLRTRGAASPSGLDAYTWRRLCTSFKKASNDLCHALAITTKCLCSVLVDPRCISPLLACHLIALDKNPDVRPIGIGETPCCIIAKAVLSVIKDAVGSSQLCAGQIAGAKAAIHAVRECFQQDRNEAVLLIVASNAFNSLNHIVALHNIRFECPAVSTNLINTYREPSIDGEVIYSQQGTM